MKNILFIATFLLPAQLLLADTTWTGATNTDWFNAGNWDAGIPDTNDVVFIGNGATVDINGVAEADYVEYTGGVGGLTTINLTGGSLTESGNKFTGRSATDTNVEINISNATWAATGGASFYGPDDSTGALTFNLGANGHLDGYYRYRYDGLTINAANGIFEMALTGGVAGIVRLDNSAALNLSGSGVMVFDIFGNGSSESLTASAAADLSGGSIQFRFDDAYTPMVGDSYTILNSANIVRNGAGSNVSSFDVDGKYEITWDASQWASGDLTIDSITAIPEPSSIFMMSFAGLLLGWIQLRRRQS